MLVASSRVAAVKPESSIVCLLIEEPVERRLLNPEASPGDLLENTKTKWSQWRGFLRVLLGGLIGVAYYCGLFFVTAMAAGAGHGTHTLFELSVFPAQLQPKGLRWDGDSLPMVQIAAWFLIGAVRARPFPLGMLYVAGFLGGAGVFFFNSFEEPDSWDYFGNAMAKTLSIPLWYVVGGYTYALAPLMQSGVKMVRKLWRMLPPSRVLWD